MKKKINKDISFYHKVYWLLVMLVTILILVIGLKDMNVVYLDYMTYDNFLTGDARLAIMQRNICFLLKSVVFILLPMYLFGKHVFKRKGVELNNG